MTLNDFLNKKAKSEKITMLTCYDFWSARLLDETPVDSLLVGDSLAMVMHGHSTTLPATVDLMAYHCAAVARGAKSKFIVADMPFLSFRKDLTSNMNAVEKLMATGCHGVKLEGAHGNLELVRHVVQSGVPVMGHLGLTPQSIHQLGGFRIQGRNAAAAKSIMQSAFDLQEAGVFAVVLECVPTELAMTISKELSIPTIGIGAGPHTDGQILVLQDLLGLNGDFKPKFLKKYLDGGMIFKEAIERYTQEVKSQTFPSNEETYQ